MNKVRLKQKAYKGFERWWNAGLMQAKMLLNVTIMAFVLHVITVVMFAYSVNHTTPLTEVLKFFATNKGWNPGSVGQALKDITIATSIMYPFVIIAFLWYFRYLSKKENETKHIRGARLITHREYRLAVFKDDEETDLPLGEIQLPVSFENKHVLVLGRPGSGKTNALNQVISRLRERREKAIIYDFKGDYLSKFYDPETDIIFNPLDTRTTGWTIMDEIKTVADVDTIARSLISPAIASTDPYWNDAARDVLSGIMHYLLEQNERSNKALWAAVSSPVDAISRWLKHTRGGERGFIHIQDPATKQAMSVHSVLMQYAKSFEVMAESDGEFSITRFINDPDKKGFVFITNYAGIRDTLRPVLSLLVDLAAVRILSMKDDITRRIFMILDEFGTLQRLSSITDILTNGRSKGASVWIGIQDVGRIEKTYSRELRQSITNSCATTISFAVSDPDTAKYASQRIGEREISEAEENRSMGVADYRDGVTVGRRKYTTPLVLESELYDLPELEAYVKIGNYDVVRSKWKYIQYPDRHEPVIMKPSFIIEKGGDVI